MNDFFKGTRFKILLLFLVLVLFFMLRASYSNTGLPLMAKITGMVLTPIQAFTTSGYNAISDGFSAFLNGPAVTKENDKLKEDNSELRNQLVELERYKIENSQLKEYLDIKEQNDDFEIELALVVGRDTADSFYEFTIDKGSKDGISLNDPVITSEGLVGLISRVEPTFSMISTILDTTMNVGVMNVVSHDVGISEGTVELSLDGKLRISYLPRDSTAKKGDIVVTTGVGGIFPRDIIVGEIEYVQPDSQGLSLYGVLNPFFDIRTVSDVIVIKDFAGQTEGEE